MTSRALNPLAQWLEIPESESKPNHYDLLGLPEFEKDERKIKAAYYRRVAKVSAYQTGDSAEACKKLLHELAQARDCLIDLKARARYDARLAHDAGARAVAKKQELSAARDAATASSISDLRLQPSQLRRSTERNHDMGGRSPSPRTSPASSPMFLRGRIRRSKQQEDLLRIDSAASPAAATTKSFRSFSPFGMLSVMRTPEQIVAELVATRGLTPFQAQVVLDRDPADLVVGPYLLEAKFPTSCWGNVYAASRDSSSQLVSLRVLPPNLKPEFNALKKLVRKVNKIDIDRFQRPIDCGHGRDGIFLASEYIPGQDLKTLVDRDGALSAERAVFCAARMVEALALAESRGLRHLELRPSKVLINRAGDVIIRDLALANLIATGKRRQGNTFRLTQALPIEHLNYASPELLLDESLPSFHADMYSVGCILYFLLTGKPVFSAEDPLQTVIAHRESPIPSVVKSNRDLPGSLDACLRKLLAKRPSDRYKNYAELHKTLKGLYRSLAPSGACAEVQWGHIDESLPVETLERVSIRRINPRRLVVWTGIAVVAVVTFAMGRSKFFEETDSVKPNVVNKTESTADPGPKLIYSDDSTEIPVIESVDSFDLR